MANSKKAADMNENETTQFDDQESAYSEREHQIAESAYFRAEKRGFIPGQEIDDWITAEQELNTSFSAC